MAMVRTIDFLPKFFRTGTNSKFLKATLDQMVAEPDLVKLNGYVGRKNAVNYKPTDNYLTESTSAREKYQLEPSIIGRDPAGKINFVSGYQDILSKLQYMGVNTDNQSRLFSNEFYTFNGLIDFDKFVNFSQYYWLPSGPDAVSIFSSVVPFAREFEIQPDPAGRGITMDGYGPMLNPTITLARRGTYTFTAPIGSKFWIQTEPGIAGYRASQDNVSTREILGAKNNGSQSVVFTVPLATAQDRFLNMKRAAEVDIATTLHYADVQGKRMDDVLAAIGRADGYRQIAGKTVVFLRGDTDIAWDAGGVYASQNEIDVYDYSEPVPEYFRGGVWQISSDIGPDAMVSLSYVADVAENEKVLVREGVAYSNRELYRDLDGRYKEVPVISSIQDTLYYQDGDNPDIVGIIRLVDAGIDAPINISDIIGNVGYTSPNGVVFTNGLKIQLDENVTPAKYANGTYYVEGVGSGIKLVDAKMLITPEPFNKNTTIGYDTITYDSNNLETTFSSPLEPSYITINRASQDLNPWARGNRWFHEDVINATAAYNLSSPMFDQTARAARPIIEFDADLVLFNHGTSGKRPINLLDTVTTDVKSLVDGKEMYSIDGSPLTAGMRVIFAADSDPKIRNKIFKVTFFSPTTDSSVSLLRLVLEDDGEFDLKQNIVVTSGSAYGGKSFWFNGTAWQLSQQKSAITQEPLFDVFDRAGDSFGNVQKYENTTFAGTKVFSYKRGSGKADKILGFPLSYRSFNSIGDIVFDNNFGSDSFTYSTGTTEQTTLPLIRGVVHQVTGNTVLPRNMWSKTEEPSVQFQQFSYVYAGSAVFALDLQPLSSRKVPTLKAFVNNKLLQPYEYLFMAEGNNYTVTILASLTMNDKVDVYVSSDTYSSNATYQTPLNLDNNSVNDEFLTVTLGQMRNHVEQCFSNSMDTVGEFPGASNMRDIVVKDNPGKILQHSAPLTYASLFLTNKATNFERGLDLARKEYTRFKNKFLELAFTLSDLDPSDIPGAADAVLQEINMHKTPDMPWYRSDMLAYGADKTVVTHRIVSEVVTSYEISSQFDVKSPSNKSVYVYLDGVQLTKGQDYSFSETLPEIILTAALVRNAGSVLHIFEYENTDGCWIPETPTKLGLYPVFTPTIYVDTSFRVPQQVIRGHDGSLTIAFGDFRDELLLELELRIYNNIKTVYDPARFDINSILPGKFRKTTVSLSEITAYLSKSFLKWVGTNRLDYITNTFYANSDGFTWNYRSFVDVLDGEPLPGAWRGIFRYFFDCETPHLTPWEMLGFTDHPLWWDDTYGPAPYTSGNMVLWDDLEAGRIIKGPRAGIHQEYQRPGLTSILPVNEYGELLSPHEFIVRQYEERNTNLTFIVGDVGPVEAAWRRSSEYAYAVQLALALAAPAQYFGLQVDTHQYVRDLALDQFVLKETNARIRQSDIKIHGEVYNGQVHYGSSYINWVADYSRSLGLNALETIGEAIQNLSTQLSYKMAGFSDKKLLKIYAEQANPQSMNSSVMIPDEDYSLELHKSVPINRVSYSAVIVTKTSSGWAVEGYDLENPFFTVIPGDINGAKQDITEGAISVYRCRAFLPEKTPVSYGTEFYTRQAVADFLFGYERFLISQGFVFNARSAELNQLLDWTLSVREFLNWSQQGWAPSNILALTPAAGTLTVATSMSQIDELNDPYIGGRVLDINFKTQSNKELVVTRDSTTNVISLLGGIIGFVELIMVQYEHTIVMNNLTVFNDVIYQPALGHRQSRVKIVGKKTANWAGTLSAPGFILNQDNIPNWQPGHDYRKADLVKYKGQMFVATSNVAASDSFDYTTWSISDYNKIKQGLLPNFANIAQRIEDFYEVDDVNLESDTDVLSKGLIGFRSRKYFNDFAMDDASQIRFYQGYIRDKGSKRAIESLTRANLDRLSSDISFYEDWAFRVGEYGAIDSTQDIEIKLNEAHFTHGPAFITLLGDSDRRPLDRIGVKYSELYKRPSGFDTNLFLTTDSPKDRNFEFQTAGPVRIDDADYTLFDIRDYAMLGENIDNIGAGTRIWVAHDYESKWNIFRIEQTGVQIHTLTNLSNQLIRIRSNEPHGMSVGEIILLKNISEIFDGFYQIVATPTLNDIVFVFSNTDLTGFEQATSLSGYVLRLGSMKMQYASQAEEYTPKFGWKNGDKIWAEHDSGELGWAVYEKASPWQQTAALQPVAAAASAKFGSSMAKGSSTGVVLVAAPGQNRVHVYEGEGTSRRLLSTLVATADDSSFGLKTTTGSGKYAIVTAMQSGEGVVHVFERQLDTFVLVQTCVIDDNPQLGSLDSATQFGASIALSDNDAWLYIGSPDTSQVYVYALGAGSVPFVFAAVLQGPNTLDSGFGSTLAIDSAGARIAVGAPNAEHPVSGAETGAVYVFDRMILAQTCGVGQTEFSIPAQVRSTAGVLRRVTIDLVEVPLASVTQADTIAFVTPVETSSVVRFEFDNMFLPAQKLEPIGVEKKTKFGSDIVISKNGTTIAIGAPLADSASRAVVDSGAVYRYVDQATINGQIRGQVRSLPRELFAEAASSLQQYDAAIASGEIPCMLPGLWLSINDFPIFFTGVTLTSVVQSINDAKIPGIKAAATGSVILLQASKSLSTAKLTLSGLAIAVLGLHVYTKTQKIENPDVGANARFGARLAMNEDGSKLAISSPTGTTVGDMSIDAGATVFDDKSTGFVTQFRESGAVFVYQCLPGGTATFTPIPEEVSPPDDNSGGGGGGGGEEPPPSTSVVILRDTFTGTGQMTSAHVPDAASNPLCSWVVASGDLNNGWLALPEPSGYAPEWFHVLYNSTPNGPDPWRDDAVRYSTYADASDHFMARSMASIAMKFDVKLENYYSTLVLAIVLTGAGLWDQKQRMAYPLPLVVYVGPDSNATEFTESGPFEMAVGLEGDTGNLQRIQLPGITVGASFRIEATWVSADAKLVVTVNGASVTYQIPIPVEMSIVIDSLIGIGILRRVPNRDYGTYGTIASGSIDFIEIIGDTKESTEPEESAPIFARLDGLTNAVITANNPVGVDNLHYQDFIVSSNGKPTWVWAMAIRGLNEENPLFYTPRVYLLDAATKAMIGGFDSGVYELENPMEMERIIESGEAPLEMLEADRRYIMRVHAPENMLGVPFALFVVGDPSGAPEPAPAQMMAQSYAQVISGDGSVKSEDRPIEAPGRAPA